VAPGQSREMWLERRYVSKKLWPGNRKKEGGKIMTRT
jgi:hypothetical protein